MRTHREGSPSSAARGSLKATPLPRHLDSDALTLCLIRDRSGVEQGPTAHCYPPSPWPSPESKAFQGPRIGSTLFALA